MSPFDQTAPCVECRRYQRGHLMHAIHAKWVGLTPWGWRDAVVTGTDGLTVSLEYVDVPGAPTVWHHRGDLVDSVEVGDPVALHEEYWALSVQTRWFGVAIRDGVGNVPEPSRDEQAWWQRHVGTTPVATDLATGIGLPLDHPDQR